MSLVELDLRAKDHISVFSELARKWQSVGVKVEY